MPKQFAELRAQSEQQMAGPVATLTRMLDTLIDDVGDLKNQTLEMLYRERAAAYLSRIARRIKTLSTDEVAILLDDAVDEGQLADAVARRHVLARGKGETPWSSVHIVGLLWLSASVSCL